MKISKVLLNIATVVSFLFGALYIFSLAFIPIGIYCFIAGKRFSYKAEHLNDTYTVTNKELKSYTIFVSIACFPLGLIAIIPYYLIASNKIKITEFKVSVGDIEESETITNTSDSEDKQQENQSEIIEETEEEKIEKFEKLKNFKEKGIISEEELEMAREQLFGKKD